METTSRRSFLQARILVRLHQEPARTLSGLATGVKAKRPSVSRSLKTLQSNKLVQRTRKGWALTAAGVVEADRCSRELSSELLKASSAMSQTFSIADASLADTCLRISEAFAKSVTPLAETQFGRSKALAKSLTPLAETHFGVSKALAKSLTPLAETQFGVSKALAKSLTPLAKTQFGRSKALAKSLAPLAETQFGRSKALAKSLTPLAKTQFGRSKALAKSLAPLAETQLDVSRAFAKSFATPSLGDVISQHNSIIASAIENTQALFSAPRVRAYGLDGASYPGAFSDIQEINLSYGALLSETARTAGEESDLAEVHTAWSRMLSPSSSVASFSHSLRSEVTQELEKSKASSDVRPWGSEGLLDELLAEVNPGLVRKRKGSAQVLLDDSNPDRLSQSASSHRELIRMTLDELAPGVKADPSVPGSKRKKQVRQILDGREADFASAMGEGLDKLYAFLCKSVHNSYEDEIKVQGALTAGNGVLLFILSSRRGDVS